MCLVLSCYVCMYAARYGDRLKAVEGQKLEGVTKREAIELLSSMGTKNKLRLTVKRPCPPAQPQPVRVVLPGRWPFGFSYHAQYLVTTVDGRASSVLHSGDRIVKVGGVRESTGAIAQLTCT